MINTTTSGAAITVAAMPPIQLLVPTCMSAEHSGDRYTWFHGFCLLTVRPTNSTVTLTGEVCVGHRVSENRMFVQHLANALDPDAVLAGYELDTAIDRLGRLPLDAADPVPAIELLSKLRAMLENHTPIDLAGDWDSQLEVQNQGNARDLRREFVADECNPQQLARNLADYASACLLALGELYLPEVLQPKLIAAWEAWHRSYQPVLPPTPMLATSQ